MQPKNMQAKSKVQTDVQDKLIYADYLAVQNAKFSDSNHSEPFLKDIVVIFLVSSGNHCLQLQFF